MNTPPRTASALFASVSTVPTEPDTEHNHSGDRQPVVFAAAVSRSSTAADGDGRVWDSAFCGLLDSAFCGLLARRVEVAFRLADAASQIGVVAADRLFCGAGRRYVAVDWAAV